MRRKKQRGFTLLEIILYLGLFALILSTSVLTFYNLSESNQKLGHEVLILNEGEFILSKIIWRINNFENIEEPASGQTSTRLRLVRDDSDYSVYQDQGIIFLEIDDEKNSLNNEGTKIENLIFENLDLTGDEKFFGITVSFEIQGQEFRTLRFYHVE